jgi:hypothetical protein|tara:strand:- start:51 stop:239 length:189 start_codon:yes stop_codon:yes gene_type:complete
MKLSEADALFMESIQVGRLDHLVSVGSNITIALIICNDDQDIGFLWGTLKPGWHAAIEEIYH